MKNTTELPEFFSGFEVVGTLKDSLEACRVPQNLNVADDPYIYVQNYTSPPFPSAFPESSYNLLSTLTHGMYLTFPSLIGVK